MIMFGSLVVYLTRLALHVHISMLWSCIAHSHLLHTPLLPLSCISLYLVSSSQHVMFTLCFMAFYFVLGLSFIFSFILHPSCIILLVYTFIFCPRFSLTLCLFMIKRGRVYSRVIYRRVLSFLYDSCAHPQKEKFYFLYTFVRGDIPQGRYIYQGGKDIVLLRKLCFVCFLVCFMVF